MALLTNNDRSDQNTHFCKDSVVSSNKQLMLIKDSKTEHTSGSPQGSTILKVANRTDLDLCVEVKVKKKKNKWWNQVTASLH